MNVRDYMYMVVQQDFTLEIELQCTYFAWQHNCNCVDGRLLIQIHCTMMHYFVLKIGLEAEYQEIRNRDPTGTFYHARMSANVLKNRYTDVPSYDHSRVVLDTTETSDYREDDDSGDFINANFVDGYGDHEKAFISTQGPLAQTFCDFWRMIWEQRVQVRTFEKDTKLNTLEKLTDLFLPFVIFIVRKST